MRALSQILGEPSAVHFRRLEHGSTALVSSIDREAAPKVRSRVIALRRGEAPKEVHTACAEINRLLRADDAVAVLSERRKAPTPTTAVVIRFPGREQVHEEVPAIRQHGSVDGIVTGIRGRDETIHITLQAEGQQISGFVTNKTVAKQLATKFFRARPTIRTRAMCARRGREEALVRAGPAASQQIIEHLQRYNVFRIEAFDARAAVEVAAMTRKALDSGRKRGQSAATWAKVKYDRQIVAIAKVCGAATIYSDDGDVRTLAKTVKIDVIGLADLPLPPEKAQIEMDLEPAPSETPPGGDIASNEAQGEPRPQG
jgi:hypothetical protein